MGKLSLLYKRCKYTISCSLLMRIEQGIFPHKVKVSKTDRIEIGKKWHVSTFAGSIQGYKDEMRSIDIQFNIPHGVAIASDGTLYVADTMNHRIRKLEYT